MSMSLPCNDNFKRLLTELETMGTAATLLASQDPTYQQFIQSFPAASLPRLSLDEYCVGKGNRNTFCWWLERGLEPILGRYMPGTSRGHIVYFLQDGTVYKNRKLLALDDPQALAYTLSIQAVIANTRPYEDWRWVDDDDELYRRAGVEPRVTIGEGRKLRLLSAYHPDEALPISSSGHLGHFLLQLGYPAASLPSAQQPVARMLLLQEYWRLAQQRVPGITTIGFMRALYRPDLGFAPVKEVGTETELTISLTGGAVRNGYVRIQNGQMLFGDQYFAADENDDAVQFKLDLPDGTSIQTCLLKNRGRIKARFNSLFNRLNAAEGDKVTLSLVDEGHFEMLLEQRDVHSTMDVKLRIEDQDEGGGTMKKPLNQILYGPPGTGKTYGTIYAALQILDPAAAAAYRLVDDNRTVSIAQKLAARERLKHRFAALSAEQRVRFVTFHQSFSYEDFVEGVRAETNEESGLIRYEVMDGIFKKICVDAKYDNFSTALFDQAIERFESMLEESDEPIKIETARGNIFTAQRNGGGSFRVFPQATSNENPNYVATINNIRNLFTGDATRKTIGNASYVDGILRFLQKNCGLPEAPDLKIEQTNKAEPFVLIIDEINRGNISRIFGELITLIEPSKRAGAAEALEVTLPYSKKPFKVPDNVYLIGTMNTADRSLAGLDLALRRRFTFTEMPPKPELLDGVEVEGVNIGQMLRVMNQRITVLLDRDHALGHAYFMPLQDDPTLPRLSAIFRQAILPLLQEYFFEDWERIRWVLNDQSKTDDVAFIVEDKALDLAGLFPGVQDKLRQTPQWQLNESAFDQRAAYAGIIEVTGA